MEKPSIFIGSSAEGYEIAEILFAHLDNHYRPYLWRQGLFVPGTYPMETLEEQLRKHDFAVILGTPDDVLTKRHKRTATVRDNLVFELGLFMGVLGRRRSLLVVPGGVELDLPSDWKALTNVRYDAERMKGNLQEKLPAMQTAAMELRNAIDLEWAGIQRARAQRDQRVQASQRFLALRRLHGVIIQLRDLVLILPCDVLESLGDRVRFEAIKKDGAGKVQALYDSWEPDARLVNVRSEFQILSEATKAAMLELPYPDEALPSKGDLQKTALEIGGEAINAALRGENPLSVAGREAKTEFESRMSRLGARYLAWWTKHQMRIHHATNDVQDALMRASIGLGLADDEVNTESASK